MNIIAPPKPLDDAAPVNPDQNHPIPAADPPYWRSIAIGAALLPLSIYFGNYAYVVTQALLWGQTSLMRGPVFVLFLVALLNMAVRKIGKRAMYSP